MKKTDFSSDTNSPMKRSLLLLRYPKSGVKIWGGVHIFPSELGPGGTKRIDKTVDFKYYEFGPFCHERSLTFENIEEAEKFVRWHKRNRPDKKD